MLNSKLPMDVLGRVWELSDVDKDGQLDKDEFCVVGELLMKSRTLAETSFILSLAFFFFF